MNIEWIEQQVRLPLSQETVSEAVAMAEKAGRTCYKSETKGSLMISCLKFSTGDMKVCWNILQSPQF